MHFTALWLVVDVGGILRLGCGRRWVLVSILGQSCSLRKQTRLSVLVFWEVGHHNDISSRLLWVRPVRERPARQPAFSYKNSGIPFSTCKVGEKLCKQYPVSWEPTPPQLIGGPSGQINHTQKSKTLKLCVLLDPAISPLRMYPTKIILSLQWFIH